MANNTDNSLATYIRKETRSNIVINLVLNAAIAYFLFRSVQLISDWDEGGFAMDLLITGFLLCSILGGIFVAMPRSKHRKEPFLIQGESKSSLGKLLPDNALLAALVFGLAGLLLAAPALLLVLKVLGINTLSPIAYALMKGVWAAALAAVVVPIAVKHGVLQSESR